MNTDPRFRDPLYPGNSTERDAARRPFDAPPPAARSSSPGTSLAIAVLLVAALVVGIATITDLGDENIDPIQTASPGIDRQESVVPRAGDAAPPSPDAVEAEAPALEELPAGE